MEEPLLEKEAPLLKSIEECGSNKKARLRRS
jgi:hypothetical protein